MTKTAARLYRRAAFFYEYRALCALFQLFAVDLADQIDGQAFFKDDLFGNGIGDETAPARREDRCAAGLPIRSRRLDEQAHDLPLDGVWDADGTCLFDSGNGQSRTLDLRGIDGHAAHLDHILDALFEIEEAVRIQPAVIARFESLDTVHFDEGRVFLPEIAEHELIGIEVDLPHLACGQFLSVLIDLDAGAREGVADGIFAVMAQRID